MDKKFDENEELQQEVGNLRAQLEMKVGENEELRLQVEKLSVCGPACANHFALFGLFGGAWCVMAVVV